MAKATNRRKPRNLSLSDDCVRQIDEIAKRDGIATRSGTVSAVIRRDAKRKGLAQ